MAVRRRVVVAGLLGNAMTAMAMASPLLATQDAPLALRLPLPMSPATPILPPAVPAYPATAALPPWRRYAMTPAQTDGRPVISVVIDDLGVMRGTERAVALPGPLTLAWFPFAPRLAEQVAGATAHGHETLLHMPMQSFSNSTSQTGPDPLRIDLAPEVNLARLRAAIAAVPDAVGLNNHMGSVATRDAALMTLVAAETRRQGMLFLDSVVIAHSQGLPCALQAGVPAAGNDIFLDPIHSNCSVLEQLERVEQIARHRGYAITIGHPHPKTLDGLSAWLPGVAAKGFVLWPVSATVVFRNGIDLSALSAV
jgi:polysaccharide deacetylase 2 family uncharacterized protein YibQ